MPFQLSESGIRGVGLSIKWDALPRLLNQYDKGVYQHYGPIEVQGTELVRNVSVEVLPDFIRRVCSWGNYAGIAGRVLKRNTEKRLISQFSIAIDAVRTDGPGKALRCLNALEGLGTPSFASKHLRFLAPESCPVLDSIIRDAGLYGFDAVGYEQFCSDCKVISRIVNTRGLDNPRQRPGGKWYAADVENAIFAKCLQSR